MKKLYFCTCPVNRRFARGAMFGDGGAMRVNEQVGGDEQVVRQIDADFHVGSRIAVFMASQPVSNRFTKLAAAGRRA